MARQTQICVFNDPSPSVIRGVPAQTGSNLIDIVSGVDGVSNPSVGASQAGAPVVLNPQGRIDSSLLGQGTTAVAGEALLAGNLVHLYSNGGVLTMERAFAASTGVPPSSPNPASYPVSAEGFVTTDVNSAETATVSFVGLFTYFDNNSEFSVSDLGKEVFLSPITAGGITKTRPSGIGQLDQSVGYVVAFSGPNQVTVQFIAGFKDFSQISGIAQVVQGGTGADLSLTGGANRFVRQSTVGGPFTVSVFALADIPQSGATTGQAIAWNGSAWVPTTEAQTFSPVSNQYLTGYTASTGVFTAATVTTVSGITVSGVPSAGQVLTATGASAANWQTPSTGPTGILSYNLGATVQQIEVTANVLTATLDDNDVGPLFNPDTVGLPVAASITFSNLTGATFLNGQTVTILTSSGWGGGSPTITANFVHANYAPTADVGNVSVGTSITFSALQADNVSVFHFYGQPDTALTFAVTLPDTIRAPFEVWNDATGATLHLGTVSNPTTQFFTNPIFTSEAGFYSVDNIGDGLGPQLIVAGVGGFGGNSFQCSGFINSGGRAQFSAPFGYTSGNTIVIASAYTGSIPSTNLTALNLICGNSTNQVAATQTGIDLAVVNTGGGTLTSPTGMFITPPAGGTVTDFTGLHIESQVACGGTSYGILCDDGVSKFSGLAYNIVTKFVNYTATRDDHTINCNGTFTLTLPTGGGLAVGQEFYIKNIGVGVITVSSAVNIDGAPSLNITTQYDSITVQWDGTQYWIY